MWLLQLEHFFHLVMHQYLPAPPLVLIDCEFRTHEVVELKQAQTKGQIDEKIIQLMIVFSQKLSVLRFINDIVVEVSLLFYREDQTVLFIVNA